MLAGTTWGSGVLDTGPVHKSEATLCVMGVSWLADSEEVLGNTRQPEKVEYGGVIGQSVVVEVLPFMFILPVNNYILGREE